MRVLSAVKADIRFQFKQGFYFVYAFVTIIYMIIIGYLPKGVQGTVVPLTIFSDPSIIGFIFIGAIMMLEKVQGILEYLVVTPLRSREYLLSKVLSLAILALSAGIAITLVTYEGKVNWLLLIPGIILSSVFTTLLGVIAVGKCRTMNQFFIRMVPFMLFIVFPCFSLIGFPYSYLLDLFPGAAGMMLVWGSFNAVNPVELAICFIYLLVIDIWMFIKVDEYFTENIVLGGEG